MLHKRITIRECGCEELIKAIDRYIAKVDDDLEEQMNEAGYADAKDSVSGASDLEDEISEVLHEQTNEIVNKIQGAGSLEEAKDLIEEYFANNILTKNALIAIFSEYFSVVIPSLADSYIKQTAGDMVISEIRYRTSSWIDTWSDELSELMQLTSNDDIGILIQTAINNGDSVEDLSRMLMENGIRNEEWRARRAALTEMLRAHSVAQQEAMTQSPVVNRKMWRHSGSYKSKPRENHVAMDGQVVEKDQPYELHGADGSTYYPMYPRDSSLPPRESVNCGCISQPIVDDDILGMSLEERQRMQQEIIDSDNGEWEKELDNSNKANAGITPYSSLENFKEKPRENQVKYLGKAKMGLYDAGLIDSDEMLEKVKKTTLRELRETGIFTVETKEVNHATIGDFSSLLNPKKPAGGMNGGNMDGGGHSQANIEELTRRGIKYEIVKTYDNKVRIGGVENHTDKQKRLGESGQSWFPEDWDSDKVAAAGTYASNRPAITEEYYDGMGNISGYKKCQEYDGVTVCVFENAEHKVKTIFPDADQREVGK